MINYSQILTLNYPDTQWALYGEEYSGLEWYDSTPKKFGYKENNMASTIASGSITI